MILCFAILFGAISIALVESVPTSWVCASPFVVSLTVLAANYWRSRRISAQEG